eukprot:5633782-Pleurochrysis_carterae.AAC.3
MECPRGHRAPYYLRPPLLRPKGRLRLSRPTCSRTRAAKYASAPACGRLVLSGQRIVLPRTRRQSYKSTSPAACMRLLSAHSTLN